MRTNKFLFHTFALLIILAMVLGACTPKPTEPPVTQPPATQPPVVEPTATEPPVVDPMAELVAAAEAEGMLTTIALPHDWCNYGGVIDAFKAKYPGIEVNELNPDAGSGEVVQ